MARAFVLPDLGEGLTEAEIVKVLVQEGDLVREDAPLLEVETDKATVEIPSPVAGRVTKIHVQPGQTVKVGAVLVTFEEQGGRGQVPSLETTLARDLPPAAPAVGATQRAPAATPATRRRARELGVDLRTVRGTGPGGRVTDDDVRAASAGGRQPAVPRTAAERPASAPSAVAKPLAPVGVEPPALPRFEQWGPVERQPLSHLRRTIAERMTLSATLVPHVTHFDRADITELDAIIRRNVEPARQRGLTLTLTSFLLKAAAQALLEHPQFNASLDPAAGELVLKRYYHLGVAVATDRGLIVPVIRDVDRKPLPELQRELAALAQRVREGKATLEDLRGGTFTLTNIGALGGPGAAAGARRCGAWRWAGAMPATAPLYGGAVLGAAEGAREFGVAAGATGIALETLRKWKAERVVGRLARGLAAVARSKGVEVIGGRGVFEDSRTLRVEGDEPQKLRFTSAVVATGSAPSPLPGLGLAPDRVMDSTAALELPDVPERLLVVGGGYIGLELGQVYAALGSKVMLVEMTDGLLPGVDRDLVQPLARQCEKLFVKIRLDTTVTSLRETGSGIEARFGGDTVAFDRVLVAVGRRAVSADLGLETTRVRPDARGVIAVDERCRTEDPRIWAAGDVTGEPMLAHRAMRQGKVAAEAIAGRPAAFDNVAVPAVVFTDPEVAWCGLTESEATRAGRPVRLAKFPWAASGRAATLGRSDGLTKLIVDPDTGRVLGVGIVGPGAGELIAEGAVAVETALTVEDLAVTIHAHPTLSETLMEAAETLLRPA